MRVLVACEESQAVTTELRKLGHDAFSCDVIMCSGEHPEWHIMQDVIPLLEANCTFTTCDGARHIIDGRWDMIIAFPPCTYLTNAGTRHFSLKCNTQEKIDERIKLREEAAEFFMKFVNADCDRIAIENPVGYMNSFYRTPDQVIHPYYFADGVNDKDNYYQKRTCLWLKGLPLLSKANELPKPEPLYFCAGKKCKGKAIGWCEGIKNTTGGQAGRAKARSKTFSGVAKAMAEQWGTM